MSQSSVTLEDLKPEPDPASASTTKGTLETQTEKDFKTLHWIRELITKFKEDAQELSLHLKYWLKQLEEIQRRNSLTPQFSHETSRMSFLICDIVILEFAQILTDRGHIEEAFKLYEIIFEKQTAALGPDNLNTIQTKYRMAFCLVELRDYSKALEMYHWVYEKQNTLLGCNNDDTIRTQHNIAVVLRKQRNYGDALKLFQDVYKRRVSVLGPYHVDTVHTDFQITYCFRKLIPPRFSLETVKE